MAKKIKPVNVGEVEYLAHKLAQKLLSWDEPIPDFETRRPYILESALMAPFQTFNKKDLYKGLIEKAAILFYVMIKNHPFQNGNKRTALTTLLVFMHKNKKWIHVDNQEFYNFAKWVAESNPKFRKQTISAIEEFVKTYMVDLEENNSF